MTPDQFQQACRRTRLRPKSMGCWAARLVLVENLTVSEAAREVGVKRQTARIAVKAAMAGFSRIP